MNQKAMEYIEKQNIKVTDISIIINILKNEITEWLRNGIIKYPDEYLDMMRPDILKDSISNRVYNELFGHNVDSAIENIRLLDYLIREYEQIGMKAFSVEKGSLRQLVDNVYFRIEPSLNQRISEYILEQSEGAEWENYLRQKKQSKESIINFLIDELLTEKDFKEARFKSTQILLETYKSFRDKIAHGHTIVEALKSSENIVFKEVILRNEITSDYLISLEDYLIINNYWK